MTGSTLTCLAANPEISLISMRSLSIRTLDAEAFVPLRFFNFFFTQKYSFFNPLMEHQLLLTGEQYAKLKPLIPPPYSSVARP